MLLIGLRNYYLHLATARDKVELVSSISIPAFTATELVALPVKGRVNKIVAPIEHVIALLAVAPVLAPPCVEDDADQPSEELVCDAKAAHIDRAVLSVQLVRFVRRGIGWVGGTLPQRAALPSVRLSHPGRYQRSAGRERVLQLASRHARIEPVSMGSPAVAQAGNPPSNARAW